MATPTPIDIAIYLANNLEPETSANATKNLDRDKHGPWVSVKDAGTYVSRNEQRIRRSQVLLSQEIRESKNENC